MLSPPNSARPPPNLLPSRSSSGSAAETISKLKAEVQHECKKTAQLRHELADRAEEMVRTHVQLRDVTNELGVSQVGSGVDIRPDRPPSERERDDLAAIVEALRKEMAGRSSGRLKLGASPAIDQGDDLLVDC